ncbi:autophagy protein 16-domain-containing protein [Lipomyces kononenkoae]|uniref:Autophagy protein 16-domain-containing protein n=1 Tax=Lipomyces kononenkoae TaxID=34357 RepID=A0ACC3T353_LIPKO
MAADWRSIMVKAIETERDVREMRNYYIIEAYAKLAERVAAAETKPADARTGLGSNSHEHARTRTELESVYKDQSTSKSRIENLQVEAEKLKHYNSRILAEYNTANKTVNMSTNGIIRFEQLQLDKKKLESRLKTRDEEYRERNKSIQILQDEILTYQIQLNVAEDKVNKLEKENRELVNRWMERVSREAEKLNDANAFLESIDRTRQRNREAIGEPKPETTASPSDIQRQS